MPLDKLEKSVFPPEEEISRIDQLHLTMQPTLTVHLQGQIPIEIVMESTCLLDGGAGAGAGHGVQVERWSMGGDWREQFL